MRQTFRNAVAGILIAAGACTDAGPRNVAAPDDVQASQNHVSYVSVCCSRTVYRGTTTTMEAYVYDWNNQRIFNQGVFWSHSANGVASTTGSGDVVTINAVAVGTTTIYANVEGKIGSATLTVIAPPVLTSIQIQNAPISAQMGYSKAVTAKAFDQYGNQMNNVGFTWSVQNTSIATVSSNGTLTPVSPGTTTITASANGVSASAQLQVTPQLNASLDGPNTIWTPGYYQWTITPSGGDGTYSYQWYVDYAWGSQSQPLGTGNMTQLWVDENTGPFIIRAVVTSGGSTLEPGTMVCNFIAGAHC